MYMLQLRTNAGVVRDSGWSSLVLEPLAVQQMDRAGLFVKGCIGGAAKRRYNRANNKGAQRGVP